MVNVIAYCVLRFNEMNEQDTDDIHKQRDIIVQYCSEHDMKISEWQVDNIIDGQNMVRPQLDALLYGEYRNQKIKAVIISNSSVISADIREFYYDLMLLKKRGIDLISATQSPVDDGTGLGNVYTSMMNYIAEREKEKPDDPLLWDRDKQRIYGAYYGGMPPYGYRSGATTLVIVESEAKIVREIFARKANGENRSAIARALNAEGYKTRRGNPFNTKNVQIIWANELEYRGWRADENGKLVSTRFKPILTDSADINEILSSAVEEKAGYDVPRGPSVSSRRRPGTLRDDGGFTEEYMEELWNTLDSMGLTEYSNSLDEDDDES